MTGQEHTGSGLSARCRPDKSGWALVVLGAALGLAAVYAGRLPPHKPGDALLWGVMAAACLVPALLGAAWLLRARVVADDAGLHRRSLGGWRAAAWAEVTDYFDALVPGKPSQRRLVVETRRGRLRLSEDAWGKGIEALRQPIAQRATQARAQAWEVQGTRRQDPWPRVFRYDTPGSRWTPWLVAGLSAACLVALVSDKWQALLHDPGRAWDAAALGVFLLLCGVHVWLILGFSGFATSRRSQRITASLEGLVYAEKGETRRRVAWADVTAYGTVPLTRLGITSTGYRVVTPSGAFDFSAAITDVALLREIIRRYATGAACCEWKVPPDDTLGGVTARWSSGCEGVGERVYRYRTRTNRALLWFHLFFAALVPISFVLHRWAGTGAKDDPIVAAVLTTLMGGSALWALWRYHVASVQVDGDGITQHTLRGPRRLRWDQVEQFCMSGGDLLKFGNVTGAGTRIRFWVGIADADALQEEIARRATHSRNRTWEQEDKEPKATRRERSEGT